VPVVYHEHDTPGSPTNRILGFIHAMRRRLARVALVCVIPQKERLVQFRAALNPRCAVCVWNCPARDEVLPPRDAARSNEFVLWYHGSLNGDQYPANVISAIALLPSNVRVRFAGYETVGHAGFVKQLLELAERIGVADRVEYLGTPRTRPALYALAAKANVGLVLFARSFREPMIGASNKPFDYLACGLALLLTDTAEWSELYGEIGCGRATNPESVEAIAATIRGMRDNPNATRAMGEAGRQRILDKWNYETQFEPVRQFLEGL
jgi:glycosyltransferase involved in cell wall biosynthesis